MMKQKIRKTIIAIVIIAILMVFNIWYAFVTKEVKLYDKSVDSGAYNKIINVNSDTVLTQDFKCNYENLSKVSIFLATNARTNAGEMNITITEKGTKNVLAKKSYDVSTLKDTEFNEFKFDTIKDSKNKELTMTLTFDFETEADTLVFYKTIGSKEAGAQNIVEAGNAVVVTSAGQEITDKETLSNPFVMKAYATKVFDLETILVLIVFEVYIYLFMKLLYKYLA